MYQFAHAEVRIETNNLLIELSSGYFLIKQSDKGIGYGFLLVSNKYT